MKPTISILIATTLLVSGCATFSGGRSSREEGLKAKVTVLEERVGELDKKLAQLQEQYALRQAESKAPTAASGAAAYKETALSPRQVQTALTAAGFYKGAIDGNLGPKTRKAVKAFQRANGLTPDGMVGLKTSAALAKHLEGKE
jgi:murein L,D-transpeptidase YcbB/YkuD